MINFFDVLEFTLLSFALGVTKRRGKRLLWQFLSYHMTVLIQKNISFTQNSHTSVFLFVAFFKTSSKKLIVLVIKLTLFIYYVFKILWNAMSIFTNILFNS